MKLGLDNYLRTFPHSNSVRKDAAKYDIDVKEMEEEGLSTDTMPTLRKGKHGTPDQNDDVPRSDALKSWKTKRKGTRHRDRDSIRTRPVPDENPEDEEEELNL